MTSYYGIGCMYSDDNELSKDFYSNNTISIGSHNPNRLYFKGLFENIKKDDIVFLKTKKRGFLRIKAVGFVDKNDEMFESEKGYSKRVNWLHFNSGGIIDIPLIRDGGNQRISRLYQEFNPNIIEQIDKLIEKYKKN